MRRHENGCSGLKFGSEGERMIAATLESLGVDFVNDRAFNLLSPSGTGQYLRWDFRIDTEWGVLFIEFNGRHHYVARSYPGKTQAQCEAELRKQQLHDKEKVDYAIENGHFILWIDYRDEKKFRNS